MSSVLKSPLEILVHIWFARILWPAICNKFAFITRCVQRDQLKQILRGEWCRVNSELWLLTKYAHTVINLSEFHWRASRLIHHTQSSSQNTLVFLGDVHSTCLRASEGQSSEVKGGKMKLSCQSPQLQFKVNVLNAGIHCLKQVVLFWEACGQWWFLFWRSRTNFVLFNLHFHVLRKIKDGQLSRSWQN